MMDRELWVWVEYLIGTPDLAYCQQICDSRESAIETLNLRLKWDEDNFGLPSRSLSSGEKHLIRHCVNYATVWREEQYYNVRRVTDGQFYL